MPHALPELPYDLDALAPRVSRETLEYHYGKHHAAHVKALNALVPGTPFEETGLEAIVREADPAGALFEQASLAWSHDLYWRSMKPAVTRPDERLARAVENAFGTMDALRDRLLATADGVLASGWLWLLQDRDGALDVRATADAGNPLREGMNPLWVCDLWEHAYYIDYRNARRKHVEAFWSLANWTLASERFAD